MGTDNACITGTERWGKRIQSRQLMVESSDRGGSSKRMCSFWHIVLSPLTYKKDGQPSIKIFFLWSTSASHLPSLFLSKSSLSCSLFQEHGVLRNGDRPRRSENFSLWRPLSPPTISTLFLSLSSNREFRLSSISRVLAARSEQKRCRRTSAISFLIFSLLIFSLIAGSP